MAVTAHGGYVDRFRTNLKKPGIRVPITTDARLFKEASELGRTVIWLHTFGERFADPSSGRPAQPPRLPQELAPKISRQGAIGANDEMPNTIKYDSVERRLHIGDGYIDGVSQETWDYKVSGKGVLQYWFSYRKANRNRPIIGNRRKPSPLCEINPDHWLAEYTTELINLINIIGRLVELEPLQRGLLEKICNGDTIRSEELGIQPKTN
jgi:hypothetical protein